MSSLLGRLFESEFFSPSLAVSYLKIYSDSIGISHYLVNRLEQFDRAEVEFYWPQLCHLLVTRPTESTALELFIVRRCQDSTHIAMLTLWFLQTYLHDLSQSSSRSTLNPNDNPSFAITRRVFNRVQNIIFVDPEVSDFVPPGDVYAHQTSSAALQAQSKLSFKAKIKEKISPKVPPVAVGIGIMAGSIAVHNLVNNGKVAIDQGRRLRDGHEMALSEKEQAVEQGKNLESDEDSPKPLPKENPKGTTYLNTLAQSKLIRGQKKSWRDIEPITVDISAATKVSYLPGAPLTSDYAVYQSRSTSNLPSRPRTSAPIDRSSVYSSSHSPLDKNDSTKKSPSKSTSTSHLPLKNTPSASVPLFVHPNNKSARQLSSPQISKTSKLPKGFLSAMLRLHASRKELELIRTLQDISNRLVIVPKKARLSALRAELTVLNHRLPIGCCIGMGCHGDGINPIEDLSSSSNTFRPHHRVIRIAPSEAVVLNSADRAPFLIMVEILVDDLDFDPDRRQNAEDLRKILGANHDKSSTPDLTHNGLSITSPFLSSNSRGSFHMTIESPVQSGHHYPISSIQNPPPTTNESPPEQMEEMDMVEQTFGDVSIHQEILIDDLSGSKLMDNRNIDEKAWAREGEHLASAPSPMVKEGKADKPIQHSPQVDGGVTLDEYSARMRMAAIMLAQLNASQKQQTWTETATGAATGVVGAAAGTVVGIGGVVGAGVGAVVNRLPFRKGRESTAERYTTGDESNIPQAISNTNNGQQVVAQRQKTLAYSETIAIKDRIMKEMMALEEVRVEKMRGDGRQQSRNERASWLAAGNSEVVIDESVVLRVVEKEDPSGPVLKESWKEKKERIRAASPYGHLAIWDLLSMIVKTGADLRQELLAIQLIKECAKIWSEEALPCWVRYFRILVTSENSGLIETIKDAVSVHSIKKEAYARATAQNIPLKNFTLFDYFIQTFGSVDSPTFKKAQDAFLRSLASYSVICYLLQLKDRHNGNILIDKEGHVIHIDFGFMLSNSPGAIGFEAAPFKCTSDYVEILGGLESKQFREFKDLFKSSFKAVRKHAERIITIVELMQKDSGLPCFQAGDQTANLLRDRFQLNLPQSQLDEFLERLIYSSVGSVYSKLYDDFQFYSQGVF